jgi:hypothetical protein
MANDSFIIPEDQKIQDGKNKNAIHAEIAIPGM